MTSPLSWSDQTTLPYTGPVVCRCCGDTERFATPDQAHAAGWDVQPFFALAPLCTSCLSGLYLRGDCRHGQTASGAGSAP